MSKGKKTNSAKVVSDLSLNPNDKDQTLLNHLPGDTYLVISRSRRGIVGQLPNMVSFSTVGGDIFRF